MKQFGLLGHPLNHSLSPALHAMLGEYPYALFDIPPEKLESFLREADFRGLNVTRPYKKTVIPYLSNLTPLAARLGSVNTILKQEDGTLSGDNTDYEGFLYLLSQLPLSPKGEKALILGSGGAALCLKAALEDSGALPFMISRRGENHYQNLDRHRDAGILVNTTPLGQLPYQHEKPLSLEAFPALKAVIDINYNPLRSPLLLEAAERKLPALNGLLMLAAQGLKSSNLWGVCSRQEDALPSLVHTLEKQRENLVLIGMPGCGKSTLARLLGKHLKRPVYDTDILLEEELGISIPVFLVTEGEAAFRKAESALLGRLSSLSGSIIACGGGVICRRENYAYLKQNGRILWIQRRLEDLSVEKRPLSAARPLADLYEERKAAYACFADHIIPPQPSPEESLKRIIEVIL